MISQILTLIKTTATTLPQDIIEGITKATKQEEKNSAAKMAMETIEKNLELAEQKIVPLCQDTGFPTFFVILGEKFSQEEIRKNILEAVEQATKKGYLRPNAVDPLTGKNSGNNRGKNFPKILFFESQNNETKISLLLKGGGSENVSDQVSLPMKTDFGKAGRNLEGVEKAVLQIVKNAEGKGCAPGILGVHIGGDRSTGYEYAKKNLLRKIGNRSEEKILARLEEKILAEGNTLNIGPMGFTGKTTLMEVFCSASYRVPASYFVTVAYSCWALRRGSIFLDQSESRGTIPCAKKISNRAQNIMSLREKIIEDENTKKISLPISEKIVRELRKGDQVLLTGKIFTGRDEIHSMVVEQGKNLPIDISGSAIYHCGPVMMKDEKTGDWKATAAGPTTSIREEDYEADFIEKTGIRAIIGKGGMGAKTQKALEKFGAVYLHAIGGAAAVYAEKIISVPNVYFLDQLGIPEAMWEMDVVDFPVIVTMEAGEK